MPSKWYEVSCSIPEYLSEAVSDYISAISERGVCTENRSVDAFSHSEIPELTTIVVKGYFDTPPEDADYLSDIETFLKNIAAEDKNYVYEPIEITIVNNEEWESSWKEHFKPLRVGKKIMIVPTWEDYKQLDEDLVIRIDPGMAFGTGGHETTRLCIELLEDIIDAEPTMKIPSLLDLGTGSGILAIAAAMLGADDIWGVDIDPLAVDVAVENLNINSLSDEIRIDTTPLEEIKRCFDIIVANILAEELVRLAPKIAEKLEIGGSLILSGILAEKESYVINGFSNIGLLHIESRKAGEWVAIHYKKVSN